MKKRRSGLKIMISLLKLLGKLKYIIIFAVFGGCLGNTCAIAVTTLGAVCVAKLAFPDEIKAPLGLLVGLTIGAGVLRGLLRFLEQYNNHFIAFKLLANLRDRIFGALRKLAPAKLEGRQKGAVISMLTSDVETLEVFYAHTISPIMIAVIVDGAVTIIISCVSDIRLGLMALAAYLIIGIAVPFISSALLKNEGMEYRKQFADTSSYFLDSVKGIRDIVLNGQQLNRKKELDEQSEFMNGKTVSIKKKSMRVGAISALFVSLAVIASLAVGVLLLGKGEVSCSHMLITTVLLSSSFGPVLSLAALPSNLTQTFASGDRILDFMAEEPVVHENFEGKKFTFDGVRIEKLCFEYADGAAVLDGATLDIRKGDIVGLAGPSGCGKSTILKLLLRFYDPKDGKIIYTDGTFGDKEEVELCNINAKSLHENAVMVSQDTYLFNDTILNNLLIAKPGAGLDEVRAACRKASIDDFIEELPNKYDTEVGLLGDSLSAGEKQRIGLARAFLSGAPLILLDEVTSNVDAINEGIILKSISDCAGEYTFVLVSHRESTLRICNKLYRMSQGKLKA